MIERIASQEPFSLLERFAQRVAEVALADPRVEGCVVGLRKLRPPVPQLLDTSGVRIARWRDGNAPAQ
jgi:dihydroneopterin aldolase